MINDTHSTLPVENEKGNIRAAALSEDAIPEFA